MQMEAPEPPAPWCPMLHLKAFRWLGGLNLPTMSGRSNTCITQCILNHRKEIVHV